MDFSFFSVVFACAKSAIIANTHVSRTRPFRGVFLYVYARHVLCEKKRWRTRTTNTNNYCNVREVEIVEYNNEKKKEKKMQFLPE